MARGNDCLWLVLALTAAVVVAIPVGANHGPTTTTVSGQYLVEFGWIGLWALPTIDVPSDASRVDVALSWTADAPTHIDAAVETDWTPCYVGGLQPMLAYSARCLAAWTAGGSDPELGWYAHVATPAMPAMSGSSSVSVPGEDIATHTMCDAACPWTLVPRAALPAFAVEYTFTVTVHH